MAQEKKKILLVVAPLVQVNTPYPSTAYLKGFLQRFDFDIEQADPGLELILRLFSPEKLRQLAVRATEQQLSPQPSRKKNQKDHHRKGPKNSTKKTSPNSKIAPEILFFLDALEDYCQTVPTAIALLQGKHNDSKGKSFPIEKIAARDFFPEGPRFQALHEEGPILEQFQSLSQKEKVQHLASLFLDDLADFYSLIDSPHFQFSRYGEKLAASTPSFDALDKALGKTSLVDETLDQLTTELLQQSRPDLLCVSLPFSGTVFGGLRMGRIAKSMGIPVVMGGGYANTELRRLTDPRFFQYTDYLTLDDGERPLLSLLEVLGFLPKENSPSANVIASSKTMETALFRTYHLKEGKVEYVAGTGKDIPFPETGTPNYEGLPLDQYLSLFEMLNPVTKLWSGYFWNKLTLAHGCYWHKCSFCDVNLDYIGRYEAEKAEKLVDKMEAISKQTGRTGFHFVDEAAPPALLRALSEELIRRKSSFQWWGNIRFDKAFTQDLTAKMKQAGCIAVTGGLEVASPRILQLIQKGVTIEQVAKVTKHFQEAGIFVHAYLMYGFPTQTTQETLDSLEVVRQLFEQKCLQSAFWHRFAATVHSPVGKNPQQYGITLKPPAKGSRFGFFSENDLEFHDPTPTDHNFLGEGLRKALYNYMHGVGLQEDLSFWFSKPVPKTKIPANFIASLL